MKKAVRSHQLTKAAILCTALLIFESCIASTRDTCLQDFQAVLTKDQFHSDPEAALEDIALTVCVPYLTTVVNEVEPYICAYTSIFTLKGIQSAIDDGKSTDTYKEDYCNGLLTQVDHKMEAIRQLNEWVIDANYTDKCHDLLSNTTNPWYDPVVPERLTVTDMCESYKLLMEILHPQNNTYEEAVIHGYVLTYEMYLTGMENEVYNDCNDTQLLEGPSQYCIQELAPALEFGLWNNSNDQDYCIAAVDILRTDCPNLTEEKSSSLLLALQEMQKTNTCEACAFVLAYMFNVYRDQMMKIILDITGSIQQSQNTAIYQAAQINDLELYDEVEAQKKSAENTTLQKTSPEK